MSTSKDSSGRGEWRDTRRNRFLYNGDHARASSGGIIIATQSRASTNALPAVASCRSGNGHRHSHRRNNAYTKTPEFLQPVRVSSSGQNEEVSRVALGDEDLCSNLIYVEESPVSTNQDASVGSIHSGNRNILVRAGRSWNSVRAQIVDLCGSVDASVSDTIVAAAGSSNGSAHEPRRKRNRELHEIGKFSDKRMRVSSAEGIVEANSAASANRHTAFVAGSSRQRTSRFRKRSTEHRDATAQHSTNAAADASLVDDLSSPLQSANETSRVRSVEDQESLRQMAADERLARELQGSYDLRVGTHEYDDAHLARLLQDEENSGILSDDNITLNSRILLQSLFQPAINTPDQNATTSWRARLAQRVGRTEGTSRLRARIDRSSPAESSTRRVEVLATLEETSQDHLTGALQLMQVDRDFNENDYEMLLALDDNVRRGAAQTKIELLPIRTILPTDILEEVCSVCLELPVAGEVVRRLPCMHEFHQDCIDAWLRRQAACPVCKADIDVS